MLRVPQSHFEGRSQYNPHSQKYFAASAEIFLSSGDFKINIKSSSSEGLNGPIFVANFRLSPKYMNRPCSLSKYQLGIYKIILLQYCRLFPMRKTCWMKKPSGLVHSFLFQRGTSRKHCMICNVIFVNACTTTHIPAIIQCLVL